MTTVNVNAVEPAGATLTIGESGDTVKVNDSVNVNTVKDAGGNTLWVSNGSGVLSSVNSAFGDALVLLSTQTASADSEIEFTSGIDSTYKEYIFKYVGMHPASQSNFQFQTSTDGGSSYGVTTTTTYFRAQHTETGSGGALGYQTSADLAQSTSDQILLHDQSAGADSGGIGILHLFNPSSTTFVKNFYSRNGNFSPSGSYVAYIFDAFAAGFFNTTSAIDAVIFRYSSGNIDAGTIKMYGVS